MPSVRSPHAWLVLAALCAAQFLVVLDITAVNVALPAIGDEFALAPDDVQWVVSAYAVTFAGSLLLAGRLADLRGRRRMFLAGMAVFGGASLACGLAPSGETLVAARAVQGLGAALVSPAALGALLQAFPEGRARTRALGTWGSVGAFAAAAGVLTGGIVVQVADWRWIFLLNVPLAAGALVLGRVLLPIDRAAAPRPLDVGTAALLTAGVAAAVAALSGGAGGPLDRGTLALAGLAVVLLASCVRRERRAAEPLIPLAALGTRMQAAANAAGMLLGAIMLASFLLLTLYLQGVLGLTPLEAGAGLVVSRGTGVAWTAVATRLADRHGARAVLVLGMAAMTVAMLLFARAPADGSYLVDVLPGMLVLGFAIPALFLAVSATALEAARGEDAGTASAVLTTSLWVGGALGVALASAVAGSAHATPALAGESLAASVSAGFACAAALALAGLLLALAMAHVPGRGRRAGARRALPSRRLEPSAG
jgi:EmrB/QacA subfamily drug resistance transporter